MSITRKNHMENAEITRAYVTSPAARMPLTGVNAMGHRKGFRR